MAARIAVAFVVREKFGWALPSLRRLYRHIQEPFRLYFVDCGYPAAVRGEIDDFLADKSDVSILTHHRYLYPNEALNLVIEASDEPYLCLVQNDVLIEEGFMDELLATFERTGCDIVWPMTFEVKGGVREAHRDEYTDTRIVEQEGRLLVQQPIPEEQRVTSAERPIQHFEMHCLMFRREAARKLAPFPVLNSREHIDCAAAAYRAGLTVYANENARANYVLPPIFDYDADYFAFRWDVSMAHESHRSVAERYGIHPFPSAMGFVIDHAKFARPERRKRSADQRSESDIDLPEVTEHDQ